MNAWEDNQQKDLRLLIFSLSWMIILRRWISYKRRVTLQNSDESGIIKRNLLRDIKWDFFFFIIIIILILLSYFYNYV